MLLQTVLYANESENKDIISTSQQEGLSCGILSELTNIFHVIYFYLKNPKFSHWSLLLDKIFKNVVIF